MEYRTVSMETYARRKHFEYFKTMAQPYVGVTVQVDITQFLKRVKEEELPFFLSFLYLVSNAANAVPELRQRIYQGQIVEYQRCPTSHTVALENNTYCYCKLDSALKYNEFLPYAMQAQNSAKTQQSLEDENGGLPLIFISTLPWLPYDSLIQPVPSPADSNPRITWGRYQRQQDGRVLMPVSILCHHALVDGLHLSQFYHNLETGIAQFLK